MSPEVFEFEDVKVDLRRVEILRAGQPVSVEPKTFDVLRFLIQHRDRLVTKEELLDVVWKDTFVTPNVLTRAVAQLRKAIGDDAFEARYIETVSKRGYRFIAPLTNGRETLQPSAVTTSASPAAAPVVAERAWNRVAMFAAGVVAVGVAAGLATVWFAQGNRREVRASASLPRLERLTIGSASYQSPAVSPDGRSVAYVSDQTGSLEIYVMGFAIGGKELVITSDGAQNMQPQWSPDGQWLAYHSRKRSGIWIVPSTGGTPRQIAGFGSMPSWSPDNETIAFTSDAGGMAGQATIWTVRKDGANAKTITQLGKPGGGHTGPSWSHDGRHIIFVVTRGAASGDVWTVPVTGGEPVKVGPTRGVVVPQFGPDDRTAYWTGQGKDGNTSLIRVRLNGEAHPIGAPEAVLPFPGDYRSGLSMARDGTAVVSLFRGASNIWKVDASGSSDASAVQLTSVDDARNTQPDFAPGGRISYSQMVVGRPSTAWLMDENGKSQEPLSAGVPTSVWTPQWPADASRSFVLVEGDVPGPPYFAWLDLATRQLTRINLPYTGAGTNSVISPDGREIAYHVIGSDGVMNVWRRSLDGGAPQQVTFDREAMSYPRFSNDGKWLAIEIKRGDSTHVGVVPRDGGPVEQLTSARGQSWPGGWAPDNDRIVFAGERDGVWNVFSVSRNTKEVKQLTHFTSFDGYVRWPRWSPSGKTVVFERAERKGSLWTLKLTGELLN